MNQYTTHDNIILLKSLEKLNGEYTLHYTLSLNVANILSPF